MRSQNGALDEDRRVGYLILDQGNVDDIQLSYFSSNNIGVININSMPLIKEIPPNLTNEIGKRLYSFLRTIANPALEENLSSTRNSVKFMSQFNFVSYEQLLKLLYVKRYEVKDWQLLLFSESDYVRLTTFIESDDEEANDLKQLFLNAGIIYIHCFHDPKRRFKIGELSCNALLQSEVFNLYLSNQYGKIKELFCGEVADSRTNEKLFYKSIVDGYSEILKCHQEIDMSKISTIQKVAYLHNFATIETLKTYPCSFNCTKIKQFVQNIASSREREMFSGYLDIYSGNTKKRLSMYESLEKLKKDVVDRNTIHVGGTSASNLYEIKSLAITQYFFYFYNHILYQGFSDIKDFFKPYIEAIICANSDMAEKPTYLGDIVFTNIKYSVEYFDLDIMTKFISTKDLSTLVNTYGVKQLNAGTQEVKFLADCFKNLCHSIVVNKTYGLWGSSFSALSNLTLMLNLADLDMVGKETVSAAVEELLSDVTFSNIFFSISYPDFRQSLRELSKLCVSLIFHRNFELVHQIINVDKFFEYAINVHFNSIRHLIAQFLSKDKETTDKIQALIDATEDFDRKVILLRLFYQQIADDTIKQKYKDTLSVSFSQLPIEAIYDFSFSGWLTPNQDSIKEFLNGILEISRKETSNMRSYPNPVDSELECAYLLHINEMIPDLNILKELSEGRPHLQFLLDPDSFDYSQVDFSDYMWENFARQEKYMTYFITHKDDIIPRIQKRIGTGEASEIEKRVLFGFLLTGNDVWKM